MINSSETNLSFFLISSQNKACKLYENHEKGGDKSDIKAMCKRKEINDAVIANLRECAKTGKLTKVDTPIAVHLETEPWLPETGLVTDALKLKRKVNSLCCPSLIIPLIIIGAERALCCCC